MADSVIEVDSPAYTIDILAQTSSVLIDGAAIVVSPTEQPVTVSVGGTSELIALTAVGPQGAPGFGSAAASQIFSSPASDWVFTHNLGYLPAITVLIGGTVVLAEVIALTSTTATIHFNTPQSGTAVAS